MLFACAANTFHRVTAFSVLLALSFRVDTQTLAIGSEELSEDRVSADEANKERGHSVGPRITRRSQRAARFGRVGTTLTACLYSSCALRGGHLDSIAYSRESRKCTELAECITLL